MTTATLNLIDEETETCELCGTQCESTDGGMCEDCAAKAEKLEERRDEALSNLEEAQSDLAELLEERKDLERRIRAAERLVERRQKQYNAIG